MEPEFQTQLERLRASSDFRERELATRALMQYGNPEAMPELRGALQDPVPSVRLAALEAISFLADEAAVPALCSELQHESWQVRAALADVLGRLRDIRAIPHLQPLISDPNDLVRARAARALGRIGGLVAASTLSAALEDRDQYVRQIAAEGLAMASDPEQVLLRRAMRHASPNVREAAAGALAAIGPSAFAALRDALLSQRMDVAILGAKHIGRLGEMAIPVLSEAVQAGHLAVRQAALESLIGIGTPATLPIMRRMIGDPDPHLQSLAARGLLPLADSDDAHRLSLLLFHPHPGISVGAARVLERLAITNPTPDLRAAVPKLERLIRRHIAATSVRAVYDAALRAIEDATGRWKDLPLPAGGPPQRLDALPVPAEPTAPLPQNLPLPSQDFEF